MVSVERAAEINQAKKFRKPRFLFGSPGHWKIATVADGEHLDTRFVDRQSRDSTFSSGQTATRWQSVWHRDAVNIDGTAYLP